MNMRDDLMCMRCELRVGGVPSKIDEVVAHGNNL